MKTSILFGLNIKCTALMKMLAFLPLVAACVSTPGQTSLDTGARDTGPNRKPTFTFTEVDKELMEIRLLTQLAAVPDHTLYDENCTLTEKPTTVEILCNE